MAFTSPFGSGGMLRQMAEAATRALRELDAVTSGPVSPPSFGPENLGDTLLFTIDPSGRVFTVRTVGGGKGSGKVWVGPSHNRSFIFNLLDMPHPLDRDKFTEYVFNFRHILYDRKEGTMRVVDSDFASEVAAGWSSTSPISRAQKVAAGVIP